MAAFLLLVLAIGGGVVVADLVRENAAVGSITVFHQPVGGYPEGWLLAAAAGLGFVVAMLLTASRSSAVGRARRRALRRRERDLEARLVERDHDRMLDEFFGPDEEAPRHTVRPARPARPRSDRREGRVGHDRGWEAPERPRYRPEPFFEEASRAAHLRDRADLAHQARNGHRR